MYSFSKKQAQLSLSIIFAIALSTATPVMAQQKSEPTAEPWPAEIGARQAIQTLPQHSDYLTAAPQSTHRAAGSDVALASNETLAQGVIVGSVYRGRKSFSEAPKRSANEPGATLATNESAAQAAISQTQPLKTHDLTETNANGKISIQAGSATSSAVLLTQKP